jgi:drug/metabolite transporter (DMT)-like permease
MENKDNSGFWAILLTAVIYGSYGCLARFLNNSFGYFTQVLFRSGIAFLIAALVLLLTRQKIKLAKKDIIKILVLSVLFFGGVITFTIGSVVDKISVVMFVFYAGSFAASFLISAFVFHEKITRLKIVALSIVLVGLITTTGFNFANFGWGLAAALVSGIFDAVANNYRKQLSGLPKDSVLLLQFLFTSILALSALLISQEQVIKEVTPAAIIAGVVWGAFWVLGNRFIMIGLRRFDFMLGQIVLSSEIFFATVLAFLFFGEIPTAYELLGGVIIFIGVCLINLDFKKLTGKH